MEKDSVYKIGIMCLVCGLILFQGCFDKNKTIFDSNGSNGSKIKFIDLSHLFSKSMPFFPGDTPISLEIVKTISNDGYLESRLSSGMHVGTHIDAPGHFIENGKMMNEVPLEKFYGKGVLIDARGKKKIDESFLQNIDIPKNSIVLILTGHDKKFRDKDYYETYPVITEGFANKLATTEASMIGFDSPSPDRIPFDIHKILFKHEILIIENLKNIHMLLDIKDFDVCAFPLKITAEGSLVRAVAIVKE